MKLYPIRPGADAVAEHFKKMSKGLLPRSRTYKHSGYGVIGSRLSTGTATIMKRGKVDDRPVVVREMTPAEVGLQQARSELSATARKTGGTKPTSRNGRRQSRPRRAQSNKSKRKAPKKKTTKKKKTSKPRDNFS